MYMTTSMLVRGHSMVCMHSFNVKLYAFTIIENYNSVFEGQRKIKRFFVPKKQ